VRWLEASRLPDGRFRIEGMKEADVFKKPDLDETWRYIDFHVTNYTLGAIEHSPRTADRSSSSPSPILDDRTL
jgi:hypothetical protein